MSTPDPTPETDRPITVTMPLALFEQMAAAYWEKLLATPEPADGEATDDSLIDEIPTEPPSSFFLHMQSLEGDPFAFVGDEWESGPGETIARKDLPEDLIYVEYV